MVSKTFRPYDPEQMLLLPVALQVIPGTPHLIQSHVQNWAWRCLQWVSGPRSSFEFVKISVVSPKYDTH